MINYFFRKIRVFGALFYSVVNPVGKKVIEEKLTYLSDGALNNIRKVIQSVEKNEIPGLFVEAGCALGGSTIQIGLTKSKNRVLNVYDVFEMIPEPSIRDGVDIQERYKKIQNGESKGIDGDIYYGYKKDLINEVRKNLQSFGLNSSSNINLIQGLFRNTMTITEPVAFAHIDCDWYDSVTVCLEQIYPNMSSGGVMIIDDYYAWSGCQEATDNYFSSIDAIAYMKEKKHNKLMITKL